MKCVCFKFLPDPVNLIYRNKQLIGYMVYTIFPEENWAYAEFL